MPRSALILLALAGIAPAAAAQDVWDDPGGVEAKWSFEGALVVAPDASENLLALAKAGLSANYVFMNGVEIGVSGGLEFQKDHPARDGFSGIFTPEILAAPQPGGAFSGLGLGPAAEDRPSRISLETAYLYVEGGYGEARIGADQGVSARFFEGGPALFAQAGLVNPALDPDGTRIARTDHDLTGPALKVSYASPRILGVRAGASFTPEADRRGLDRDPARAFLGTPRPEIENAAEFALNVSRRLPRSGVRLRASAAYSQAETSYSAGPSLYKKVATWSAGGSAEFSKLTLGGSYLHSDNGIASGAGDYSAWSLSAGVPMGKFQMIAELAGAEDDFAGLESDSWQVGLAWAPEPGWRLAGGWREIDTSFTLVPGTGRGTGILSEGRRSGIVIEITRSL